MRNNGSSRLGRLLAGAAVLCIAGAVGIASAGSAEAATGKNGNLESGEFGLYYAPDRGVPVFDLYVSDEDFSNDYFPNTTIRANDNTASYWNRDTFTWYVYTNAYHTGSKGWLDPGYIGNASSTFRNKISSAYWYDAG